MLNIFVVQLLPLLLALLGAILGVYAAQTQSGRLLCIAIALLSALTIGGITYLICDGIAFDRRVRVLGEVIRREIDEASGIDYRARRAAEARTFQLDAFVGEIEAWRNRVDEWLRQELPSSGADIRFRTGSGQVGGGPELWEYTRLSVLRSNLMAA